MLYGLARASCTKHTCPDLGQCISHTTCNPACYQVQVLKRDKEDPDACSTCLVPLAQLFPFDLLSIQMQILKRDKEDLDARYDRAMLYADMEENRKAIEGLEQVGGVHA